MQLLIEHGADINNVDTMGMTPLLYACHLGSQVGKKNVADVGKTKQSSSIFPNGYEVLYKIHI